MSSDRLGPCGGCSLGRCITALEAVIHNDAGNRGIEEVWKAGDIRAALTCFVRRPLTEVVICVGFPCNVADPMMENDGLWGASFFSLVLLKLGVTVTWVSDKSSEKDLEKLLSGHPPLKEHFGLNLKLVCYAQDMGDDNEDWIKRANCSSHLIFIERPGRSASGDYFTMTGRNISKRVAPLDAVLLEGRLAEGVVTIGIGDGGNEAGMGRVREEVMAHVTLGPTISAVSHTDALIVAGVSDWGLFAMTLAYVALRAMCPKTETVRSDAAGLHAWTSPLVGGRELERFFDICRDIGLRDGVTGQVGGTVDGLPLSVHEAVYNRMAREATACAAEGTQKLCAACQAIIDRACKVVEQQPPALR